MQLIATHSLCADLRPPHRRGRVVASRSGLVYGSMTLGMGLSGLLAQVVPVGIVLTGFGGLTVACGVLALALPAMRDA